MEKNSAVTGTPREKLRTLRILAAALATGVFIFLLICVGVNLFNGPLLEKKFDKYSSLFLPVMAGLAIIALLIAHFIYGQQIKIIRENSESLEAKMEKYRLAVTKYLAICEGMALFSIVVFFLTGHFSILIVSAVLLGFMLAKLVSMKKPETELNLSWQEQEELKK